MNTRIYHREKTVLIESKHKSFIKCWFNAGPSSATMAQHSTSVQGIVFATVTNRHLIHHNYDVSTFLFRSQYFLWLN